MAGFAPRFRLRVPKNADARMEDGFQLFAGNIVGKHKASEMVTAEPSVRTDELGPEKRLDFLQGRLAGLDDLTGQLVSVHDRHATLAQELRAGGFTHADAASQAKNDHGRKSKV